MRKRVDILGVKIDYITMSEAVERVRYFLSENKNHSIYTPNSEIMMDALVDDDLRQILNEGDMVIPDGAGVVLASKILGLNLPEKVAGVDLVKNALSMNYPRKIRYFLLGGKPGVAEKASLNILSTYKNADIAGYNHGYFHDNEIDAIIEKINNSNTDILLVALGAPKQEKFISKYKDRLNVKISMGVGGTIDVLAGTVKHAPEFMRKHGLEWLYRLWKQPSRYRRMLKLPKFILKVIAFKLTGK